MPEPDSFDFDKLLGSENVKKLNKVGAMPQPALRDKDRLTLVINLVHQHRGEQPFGISFAPHKMLDSDLEVWQRRMKVGKKWQPLDLGWYANDLKNAGYIVVENTEGQSPLVNPSKEERDDVAKRIVQVGAEGHSYDVFPGFPFVACPSSLAGVQVRCLHGEAIIKLYILPR